MGTLSRLCIGTWKSTNSNRNINTAKLLQKTRKQFDIRRKGTPPLGPGSCLDYTIHTSILIHLLIWIIGFLYMRMNETVGKKCFYWIVPTNNCIINRLVLLLFNPNKCKNIKWEAYLSSSFYKSEVFIIFKVSKCAKNLVLRDLLIVYLPLYYKKSSNF